MKQLGILGSTGSIGKQTLEVVSMYPGQFSIKLLTCHRNIDLLAEQIRIYKPEYAVVCDEAAYEALRNENLDVVILKGPEGIIQALGCTGMDMLVNALVGISGMMPTRRAIELGIDIALANKETLVTAGEAVMKDAKNKGVRILPVDSEHNAILQCLNGENRESLKQIILTASGGPFRGKSFEELAHVTLGQALNHPNWSMGKKITIDSATLMNKGFEVLEAKWLFGVDLDRISVIVHPQSIVHSMVEFIDGSVIAQLSNPDMRLPIGLILMEGRRRPLGLPPLRFEEVGSLTFEKPDFEAFPCIRHAYEAGRLEGTYPAALNAANEVLVSAFLKEEISFLEIPGIIGKILDAHINSPHPDYETILETDHLTRMRVKEILKDR